MRTSRRTPRSSVLVTTTLSGKEEEEEEEASEASCDDIADVSNSEVVAL